MQYGVANINMVVHVESTASKVDDVTWRWLYEGASGAFPLLADV